MKLNWYHNTFAKVIETEDYYHTGKLRSQEPTDPSTSSSLTSSATMTSASLSTTIVTTTTPSSTTTTQTRETFIEAALKV